MPNSQQQCQNDSQWVQVCLEVVLEEFRIAEDESCARVVVCVPKGQRKKGRKDELGSAPTGIGTRSTRADTALSLTHGFSL